jgi:NADH-ubiquinone oxidoreductase chain 2
MVLSAALDQGLIILSLVAILTSVIGAVYYLSIIREIFFMDSEYMVNKSLSSILFVKETNKSYTKYEHLINSYSVSSAISFVISIITLVILLFIFINKE